MKTFEEMNEQEKEKFETEFYALWKNELPFPDDRGWKNPFKYGRPWLYCKLEKFVPAEEFFHEKKEKIFDLYHNLQAHCAEL